jgi:hypothetical protein
LTIAAHSTPPLFAAISLLWSIYLEHGWGLPLLVVPITFQGNASIAPLSICGLCLHYPQLDDMWPTDYYLSQIMHIYL